MLNVGLKSNFADLTKGLAKQFENQIAFASTLAVNALADIVMDAERDEIHAKLKKHVPFTIQSVARKKARSKKNPTATVYLKDIGAEYIGPYIDGGKNKLYGRAFDEPVNIPLNSYGNIPRGAIKSLLDQPNVFAGPIDLTQQRMSVSGIWERVPVGIERGNVTRRKRGRGSKYVKKARSRLKLLVRFSDAHDTDAKIDWYPVALSTIREHFAPEFRKALQQAIKTAR